ncbi:MAG: helix-turn-helix domain-containing protein [bacterium]|nr:helix-turn-helix domain-containing protein [bacterium]
MLQTNPEDRPANVSEALQLIGEEEGDLVHKGRSFPDWSEARIEGRKITIILNSLYSLLSSADTQLSAEMLDHLQDYLSKNHEAYLRFLQSKLARLQGQEEEAKEWRRQATVKVYTQPDPKLKTLLALEDAQVCDEKGDLKKSQEHLDEAWEAIAKYPEPHLRLKVLYARGKTHKALGKDLSALRELKTAFEQLPPGDQHPSKGEIYGELGELLNSYGLPRQAAPLLDQSLAHLEEDPRVRARRYVQGALNSIALRDGEKALERFREARLGLSALRDLAGVIWVNAHGVRLPLAGRDWVQARRELKALRLRNRNFHYHETLLDLLELNLWLVTDQALSVHSEKLFERMNELARLTLEGKIFCDLGWPPYQTCLLLDEVFQKLGKYKEAATFHQMGRERREEVSEQLKTLGYSEEKSLPGVESMISVQSLKVQSLLDEEKIEEGKEITGSGEEGPEEEPRWKKHAHYLEEQIKHMEEVRNGLLRENRRLNEEIEQLKEQLKHLAFKPKREPSKPRVPKAPPSLPAAEPKVEAAPSDGEERDKIFSALKEFQGNRSKAAKTLGIHRRTLLEKIKKYGLEETDFLPSKEEIESALRECDGNKTTAAKKLGMSRSSFYRRLKEFGLSD